jgi:ATP/maltotriose-dependent transcriptional regulator MalT
MPSLIIYGKEKKNNDIAEALYVSTNTIKTHIIRIFTKLDVNSRSAAVNKAMGN